MSHEEDNTNDNTNTPDYNAETPQHTTDAFTPAAYTPAAYTPAASYTPQAAYTPTMNDGIGDDDGTVKDEQMSQMNENYDEMGNNNNDNIKYDENEQENENGNENDLMEAEMDEEMDDIDAPHLLGSQDDQEMDELDDDDDNEMNSNNNNNNNNNNNTLNINNNNNQNDYETRKKRYITTPYMTKYERARILGTRALQISMGAPVTADIGGETDPLEIANIELREKKIPMIIRRFLPDGSFEDWKVSDLRQR